MKSTVERLANNQVVLEVEVGQDQVEAAIDRASRRLAQQIKIPGFRPGRAPRSVIEMRVGREVLYQEALDDLIPEVYSQALKENDLVPIDAPELDILDMEDGKPLRFKATIDVKPEVTLGEYKGLEVTKQVARVTNADVERVLETMRERFAELVSVEKDGIEQGDFAVIDFTGYIDGQPFPGGAAQGYTLEVGGGSFIPGFEEQLVGAKVDEVRQIVVIFPEDYRAEDLAGKEARFEVKVHEIKEKRYPALNDDFAKDVGDFQTLLELRADIRKRLEDAEEQEAERQLEQDLIDAVVERASCDIPEKMVQRQVEHKLQHLERELYYSGLDKERYLELLGITEEEMDARLRTEAEKEVKTLLVMEALVEAEAIAVADDELEQHINELVGEGPDADARRERLEAQREHLRESLVVQQAIDLLKASAKISEVIVDEPEPSPEADDQPETDADEVGAD